jgi:hypothetical protein
VLCFQAVRLACFALRFPARPFDNFDTGGKTMKLKITDTEQEFRVDVVDDNGNPLVDEQTGGAVGVYFHDIPTFFTHKGKLHAVLGPYFGIRDEWAIYKMDKVAHL